MAHKVQGVGFSIEVVGHHLDLAKIGTYASRYNQKLAFCIYAVFSKWCI